MAKVYDRPVVLQKINDDETWSDIKIVHASINKPNTNVSNEYLSAGAIQYKRRLIFEFRYFSELEDVAFNNQEYRILYQDVPYNITDYDDYMLQHKTVKLLGVSY
jgi:SPP1 family predicted phage head-tail adaptor